MHTITSKIFSVVASTFFIVVSVFAETPEINTSDGTASIECPAMQYYLNPDIKVDVTYDPSSSEYRYVYSIFRKESDVQDVFAFRLAHIESGQVVKPFEGWSPCGYHEPGGIFERSVSCLKFNGRSEKVYRGLTIISKNKPGVVVYEIEGTPTSSVPFGKIVDAVTPYFDFDRGQASEEIQETMMDSCAYGRVRSNGERNLRGVTIGPSNAADLFGSSNHPRVQLSSAVTQHVLSIPAVHAAANLGSALSAPLGSPTYSVKDSLEKPLVSNLLKASADRSKTEADSADEILDVSGAVMGCNVKGLIVEAAGPAQTLARGGLVIESPACVPPVEKERAIVHFPKK